MAAARQYRALLLCGAAIVAGMSMSSRDSMAQMSFSGAKERAKPLGQRVQVLHREMRSTRTSAKYLAIPRPIPSDRLQRREYV